MDMVRERVEYASERCGEERELGEEEIGLEWNLRIYTKSDRDFRGRSSPMTASSLPPRLF